MEQQVTYIAKTLAGLERTLAGELQELGAANIRPQKRAVVFDGDVQLMYRANLWCRTALSILKPVFEFTFDDQQHYYDILRDYPWGDIFDHDKTMAINALAFDSEFTNTHFLAQRTKDAIVDYFMDKSGKRPNIDTEDPQIKLNVYITQNKCEVSLDSSGAPLFKRGYRRKNVEAPLNEVLGAGLVMLTGWDKQQPFYDPMCGSGTFSIEAGMLANNIAPNIFRQSFSFRNWKDYDDNTWQTMREEAKGMQKNSQVEIFASDISNQSMDATRQNLMEAGLLGKVKLEKRDFFTSRPSHDTGVVIINPPYGVRLQDENIREYYENLGATLKHSYAGFEAWILSPDRSLTHRIGLRHSSQQLVYNGPIECRFLQYKLYTGTKKIHKLPKK